MEDPDEWVDPKTAVQWIDSGTNAEVLNSERYPVTLESAKARGIHHPDILRGRISGRILDGKCRILAAYNLDLSTKFHVVWSNATTLEEEELVEIDCNWNSETKGRRKELVLRYSKNHPEHSPKEIAKLLHIPYRSLVRYLPNEVKRTYKKETNELCQVAQLESHPEVQSTLARDSFPCPYCQHEVYPATFGWVKKKEKN